MKLDKQVNFPELCKMIRSSGKWTQEEMAKKFGIHISTWKKWELGISEPSAQMAFRLCEIWHEMKVNKE